MNCPAYRLHSVSSLWGKRRDRSPLTALHMNMHGICARRLSGEISGEGCRDRAVKAGGLVRALDRCQGLEIDRQAASGEVAGRVVPGSGRRPLAVKKTGVI